MKKKKKLYCIICGEPAVLERYKFPYCPKHIPRDVDNYDPELHEHELIDWFKRRGL